MDTLFYIIEFTLFGIAVGVIIHCLKDEDKRKKLLNKFSIGRIGWAFVSAMILIYAVSWLATCGLVKIVTLLFGWEFNWAIATGIWTVHIFIMGENISVDVRPLEESDPRWIVYPNTHPGYDRRFPYECSECRVRSKDAFPYCPFCGEKLRMPVIEDKRVKKTPNGPVECTDDDSSKEGTDDGI